MEEGHGVKWRIWHHLVVGKRMAGVALPSQYSAENKHTTKLPRGPKLHQVSNHRGGEF